MSRVPENRVPGILLVAAIAAVCGRAAYAGAVARPLALDYAALTVLLMIAILQIVRVKASASKMATEADLARKSGEIQSAVFNALAHEARGPLGSIQMAASALRSGCYGGVAGRRELAGIIEAEVERIDRWLDEACGVSRVEAGEYPLNTARHDISDVVWSAVNAFGPRLAGRRVDVAIPEPVPAAECDREMVQRVLHLLLDNAAKYSPAGAPIAILCSLEDDAIVIGVLDSGDGVPEPEKTRIFQKHYRGMYRDSGIFGTGMGLASAKSLVECQGGEIWVADRPGGGAAFQFSLPAAIRVTA